MTVQTAIFRRRYASSWLIAFAVLAAVVALLPVAAGIIVGGPASPRTARVLASAPSGLYVVFSRSEGREDVILAAPASNPSDVREVARIEHLPGYAAHGAVSPDGARLALVTADAGTRGHPGASLIVVTLATGAVERRAADIDPLQEPVWTPSSDAIVVTKSSGGEPVERVQLLRVPATAGNPAPIAEAGNVLGAYPVGYGSDGELLYVVIDGSGSGLWRPGRKVTELSRYITRDWRLSPDGATLAYIETNLANGLSYRQRLISLSGSGAAAAQAADDGRQHLGVAWNPATSVPDFGADPATVGGASAAGGGNGFIVPLSYAPGGEVLAAQAWSGSSYADAGSMELAIVSASGRTAIPDATRFFGWLLR